MALQHLRSSTANKRPTPAAMSDGQIAINTEATSPGLFFKNASGNLVKVGPVHIGTTAPNASPASGGETGNTLGEQWLDTTGGTYVFKVWDGSAWRSETGTFVDVNGDTMTGALGIIAGSASTPGLFFSSDANTGIYSPGADQVAVATGGTQRLTVDTAATTSTLPVVHPLGAVGTPSITFTGDLNTGIWSPAADTVAASTAGSERLRITSAGNVGIGTTSAQQLLHVNSSGASGGQIQLTNASTGAASTDGLLVGYNTSNDVIFNNQEATQTKFFTSGLERAAIDSSGRLLVGTSSARANLFNSTVSPALQVEGITDNTRGIAVVSSKSDTFGAYISLCHQRSGSLNGNTVLSSDDNMGSITFLGSDGSEFVEGAAIYGDSDGTPGANDMPGRLVFATTADGASSPTERVRITSAGGVLVGTTSIVDPALGTNDGVSMNSDGFTGLSMNNNSPLNIRRRSSNGNIVAFRRDTTLVGTISVTTTATAYNTSSDYRLKENVTAVTAGITRLQQLKPSRFNFIADPNKTVDGFLAHEAAEVVPECVTGTKDAVDDDGNPVYQGIDQSKLVPLLTAALQEAIGEIESLKARVAALEAN